MTSSLSSISKCLCLLITNSTSPSWIQTWMKLWFSSIGLWTNSKEGIGIWTFWCENIFLTIFYIFLWLYFYMIFCFVLNWEVVLQLPKSNSCIIGVPKGNCDAFHKMNEFFPLEIVSSPVKVSIRIDRWFQDWNLIPKTNVPNSWNKLSELWISIVLFTL